jgi:WD40 repeat protein
MERVHGFAHEWEYSTGDRAVINTIVPATGGKTRCFVSLDEKSMRLWDRTREYNVCRWDRDNFVRAILPIPSLRIFIAAALDMTFKVYDSNLSRIGQFNVKVGKEDIRAVLALRYDEAHGEIFTGGLSGCQRWSLVGDRFRGFQLNHLQTLERSEGKWIDRICVATTSKLLFCCHNNNVSAYRFEELGSLDYALDASLPGVGGASGGLGMGAGSSAGGVSSASAGSRDTSRKASLVKIVKNIHEHKITGCVFQEANSYLVTSSLGFEIRVLSVASSFALVHTFVGHAKAITALLHHPHEGLIVSASVDCTLRVWNLDTLEEEYHLQTSEPIHGAIIGWSKSTVLAMTPSKVVTWRLHHIVNVFSLCRSPVVHLKHDVSDVVVAVSRDHSVRLLGPEGHCLCTLLPDSAVSRMEKVVYTPGILIGLLGSGEVFAYTTARTTASVKYQLGADKNINDIAVCKVVVLRESDDGSDGGSDGSTGSGDGTTADEDKCYLLCATAKGYVLVFDAETSEQCGVQSVHKDAISHILICGERTVACIVPTDGIVLLGHDLVPIRTISLRNTPFFDGRNIVPLSCVHATTGGGDLLLFLGLASGFFDVVDLNTGDLLLSGGKQDTLCEHDGRVCTADFLKTGDNELLIATGGDDGRLKVWMKAWSAGKSATSVPAAGDAGDGGAATPPSVELLSELPMTSRLKALSFLPDGDILFGEGDHVSRIRKKDLWLGPYLAAVRRKKEMADAEVLKRREERKTREAERERERGAQEKEERGQDTEAELSERVKCSNSLGVAVGYAGTAAGTQISINAQHRQQAELQSVEAARSDQSVAALESSQHSEASAHSNSAVPPLIPRNPQASVFRVHKLRTTEFYKSKIASIEAPAASPRVNSAPPSQATRFRAPQGSVLLDANQASSGNAHPIGGASRSFGKGPAPRRFKAKRVRKPRSSVGHQMLPEDNNLRNGLLSTREDNVPDSLPRRGVFLPAFVPFSSVQMGKNGRRWC